jgi:hypothetical protein
MCWICDPIGETSKTLNHIGDVIATDATAQAVVGAAAIAGAAYLSGGLSFGTQAAATTAAEIGATSAGSGAATYFGTAAYAGEGFTGLGAASAASSAITGAEVVAGIQSAGNYAMQGLNVAGKVVGGLNALSLVGGKPAPASQFGGSVKSIVPVYGVPAGSGNGSAQTAKSAGIVTAGSVGAGESGKAKDSTLTMLASGLTIAAIVYQFWGK